MHRLSSSTSPMQCLTVKKLLSKSNFTYCSNDVTGSNLLNACIFTISEINKLICNDLIHVFSSYYLSNSYPCHLNCNTFYGNAYINEFNRLLSVLYWTESDIVEMLVVYTGKRHLPERMYTYRWSLCQLCVRFICV